MLGCSIADEKARPYNVSIQWLRIFKKQVKVIINVWLYIV